MSTSWYYADRQQQQKGPVAADWLQGAYARGEVLANSLVWREGLTAWVPLSQVAAELGIAIAASSPPPRPPVGVGVGGRPVVVAPRSGTPILLITLIVGAVLVVIGGILLAIAIPAYHDYSQRAKISQAVMVASPVKMAVEEFVRGEEQCPTNGEAGIGTPESYASGLLTALHVGALADDSGRCAIELQIDDELGVDRQTLTMIRNDVNAWVYSTTLEPRRLPPQIRTALE